MKKIVKVNLLEENLTYKLRGIFFKIADQYGYKFKEQFYHNLCKEYFKKNNIKFRSMYKIPLYSSYSGKILDFYIPDFIIEDKIIIEIKASAQILDSHLDQLVRYLSISEYELGLLVNFGCPKIEIIRRIFTNDRKKFISFTEKH